MNKSDILTVKIEELHNTGNNIDVICITEHFIETGYEHLLHIPNFVPAAFFSRKTKRGGTCILVRAGLQFKEIPDVAKQSLSGVFESCAIELIHQKIIIICIYRIPKHNYNIFYDKLENILRKLCSLSNKQVILTGDFNIDILKRNKITLEFEQFLSQFNLNLALYKPTRLSSNSCLDNFAHTYRKDCKAQIIDLILSDHTSQILSVPINKSCKLKYWKTQKQDITAENLKKFKKYLSCLSFMQVYNANDANEAYDLFAEDFLMLYNLCFPTKTVTIKTNTRTKWISRGIKICSRKQRKLLWSYRFKPDCKNKLDFKNYTKIYKKIIQLTQKSQNNHFINTSQNKSKAAWQVINKSKYRLPQQLIPSLKKGVFTITHPKEIANEFNNFFVDVIENNIQSNVTPASKNIFNNLASQSLFMQPVSPNDLIKIIHNLKNTTTVGYDGVCTQVVKYTKEVIARPLTHIINLCITNGVFPNSLKKVIIKPLFKKDDKLDVKNYRPIAKIPIFSKIFEKVIYNSIYNYFEKYNLFCNEQKGFRKNNNINMALFDLLSHIMTSVDERAPVCALYTDMTKAFDYVSHKILLKKLYGYGIRGNILKLLESYLDNRTQCTEISQLCPKSNLLTIYTSEARAIKYGVPQGSVLGPLLFLIYINDLPKVISQNMILFADDSTVVVKCTNPVCYESEINDCLRKIINWLKSNNLVINLSKTKVMYFHQRCEKPPVHVEYDKYKIEDTNEARFLGIKIDSKLTWNPHIEEICLKLNKSAYALFQLSKKVNTQTLLIAYHGLVASVLRFGVIFWGQSTERETVFKAQKRCIRSMCGLKTTETCAPHFKSLKLLTLPAMYIYETTLFVKTNLHLFTKISDVKKTPMRSQYLNQLCDIKCRTALMKKSFFGMASKIYNKVPDSIRTLPLSKFKKALSSLLIEKCYYTVPDFLNDNNF